MNLFKKIGAVILATALALTTAVTASAETTNNSITSKGSIKVSSFTTTLNEKSITHFLISGLPSQYKESDVVFAEIYLYEAFEADNKAGYTASQATDIIITGMVAPSVNIGTVVLARSSDPDTTISKNDSIEFISDANDPSSYKVLISYADNELYYDEIVGGNNFIVACIYAYKDGKYISYNEDGSTSDSKQMVYSLISDLYKNPTSSESNTSEPTSSEPTSSEPTSSEPTSSEPTSSEPTSSEPTSSEATSSEAAPSEPAPSEPTPSEPTSSEATSSEPTPSEPTSSDTSKTEPSDIKNPATGVTAVIIGAVTIAGATIVATVKRKKR